MPDKVKFASSLTIAGTDPTGGAGIQADLKTFQEIKSYGMSVITSVVAQNTVGVQNIHHVPLNMIEDQLQAIFSDVPVHAFKTGMIANVDMMKVIYSQIVDQHMPYVMDPVMVTTSGDALIDQDARHYLKNELIPLCTLITPNVPETEFLTGEDIESIDQMEEAAKYLVNGLGAKAALVTGGHLTGAAIDVLYDGEDIHIFSEKRIQTHNTHGTGCTLSAAITAYLSLGNSLYNAVQKGKNYVTKAIKHSFDIGAGSGPTNHFADRYR